MSFSVPCIPQKHQEPRIGEEHCGVKLRNSAEEERRRREQFALPMLIRASGNPPFVRLVMPNCASVNDHCSFLLVTQKRLIIYNGHAAAIICRSKIAQMAYEIVASKELPTNATRVEIANDDQKTECHFWRHLNREEEEEGTKMEKENLLLTQCSGGMESYAEDKIFETMADGTTTIRSEGKPPEIAIFDRAKVLVFYFVSEIYVWVGSEANKSLVENAVNFARSLGHPNARAKRIVCQNDHSLPMDWTILRRISEGIVDTLFKYKFSNWPNHPTRKKQRQKSVSSVSCDAKIIQKITNENAIIRETAHKMREQSANGSGELQLEDEILRPGDEKTFTEAMRIYEVEGENLRENGGRKKGLVEFEADKCYVIEWEYRIERTGIRKLDGSVVARRECGRRRKCFFYWLGSRSTAAEQSRCALALHEKDTELCEHIRVEEGKEAPMLLHILGGLIIWGTGSNVLCVIGSSGNCFVAQEMRLPIKFRSQGIYLRIFERSIECLRGEQCPDALLQSAKALATKIAEAKGLKEAAEVNCVGANIVKPKEWTKAPKMFRFRENEMWTMSSANGEANFTFTQKDLRDCVVVDQGTHLWLWTARERPIGTFVLKVAFLYWYGEEFALGKSVGEASDSSAHLIYGGTEPNEFKALFAEWEEENETSDNGQRTNEGQMTTEEKRTTEELSAALAERLKLRSFDELRRRELPGGCDTKHLEQYLSEGEFARVFGISRVQFNAMPLWRQLTIKKEVGLF